DAAFVEVTMVMSIGGGGAGGVRCGGGDSSGGVRR
ncbi:hypothetical protein Tco_0694621, partial [Tanacetum coccineum]